MENLERLRELARQLSVETDPIKTKEILNQVMLIMKAQERTDEMRQNLERDQQEALNRSMSTDDDEKQDESK